MSDTLEVRHVSVAIERSPDAVYRYASNVADWVHWAHGLGRSIRQVGREWIADGPLGQVKVVLSEPNDFRVLDHDVTLPSGASVHNALRVLPNGGGSEVVFSVFRQPGTTDQDFLEDTRAVERDLRALKRVLEQR